MANEFCKIPPSDDTKTILDLLPPIPSINKVVDLINSQVIVIKVQVAKKATDLIFEFKGGVCPTPPQIDKIIKTRNNLVDRLAKIYNKVERLSNTISGVSNFLNLILKGIKIAGALAQGIIVGTSFIPFPIPAAVNSVVEGAQGLIEKAKFKSDGEQRLTPLVGGLISANIAVKLFASALREVICTVEAIDASVIECTTPQAEIEDEEGNAITVSPSSPPSSDSSSGLSSDLSSGLLSDRLLDLSELKVVKKDGNFIVVSPTRKQAIKLKKDGYRVTISSESEEFLKLNQEQSLRLQEVQNSLTPIPQEIISFIEQDVAEDEESVTETAYRGFSFEIETIPFTPTVNRTRALALNRDGIPLLQTELSFTSTPDILIQELKFIIDRDNLRAE